MVPQNCISKSRWSVSYSVLTESMNVCVSAFLVSVVEAAVEDRQEEEEEEEGVGAWAETGRRTKEDTGRPPPSTRSAAAVAELPPVKNLISFDRLIRVSSVLLVVVVGLG